ncbi:hypothetical protein F4804DRAFT_63812 [Jackrogersella minutella]|nr:hypothetical protein F4804DRAFT_63812 [Jackrogersella minutella]
MSIPGQEILSSENLEDAKTLLSSFNGKEIRFKFERIVGAGSRGFVFGMKMVDQSGPSLTRKEEIRFVAKRAARTHPQGERSLLREIEILQELRRAPNIQQLFRLPGAKGDLDMPYWKGPTLITEWIPNGLLRDLIERRADLGHPLPNRMLWKFFLCFCYMLVAMAWPPNGQGDHSSTRPDLPPQDESGNRPPKSSLIHGDLSIVNVMVGDFEPVAHQFVPILKLIDFGQANKEKTAVDAERDNILRIGGLMICLIGGFPLDLSPRGVSNMEVNEKGKKTTIRSRARDLDGLNIAKVGKMSPEDTKRHRESTDNLDIDLRNLLIRCMATSANLRPTLEDLVEEVRRNVKDKNEDSYTGKKFADNESDDALRNISKRLTIIPNS